MPVPVGGDPVEDPPLLLYRPYREYWQGSQFLVDWSLTDVDGEPVLAATVVGSVSTPAGGTEPMSVTQVGGVYTASYNGTVSGRHGWRLVASGAVADAVEGTFVVARSLVGLPPITTDPTTDVGLIRLLITDVSEHEPLFEDAQLSALLAAEGGVVKRAAAAALETIARSEVLISKKITTQDLSTDGPSVARELRESAKALREQARQDDTDLVDGSSAWAISVIDYDPNAAYRWWG